MIEGKEPAKRSLHLHRGFVFVARQGDGDVIGGSQLQVDLIVRAWPPRTRFQYIVMALLKHIMLLRR
jgi:hypothetical protein